MVVEGDAGDTAYSPIRFPFGEVCVSCLINRCGARTGGSFFAETMIVDKKFRRGFGKFRLGIFVAE